MAPIDWNPPQPRAGWRGQWDAFFGPGATAAEEWLQLVGGLILSGLALLVFFSRFPAPNPAQIGVAILFALDLSGGIITNASASAKRLYHREGQTWQQHLIFVLPHGVHLGLLVWLFPGFGWWFFGLFYGYLIVATLLILRMALYLQRPMAMTLYAGALLLNLLVPQSPGLEWVVPFLFLKLLIAHLLKEAPFQAPKP